MLRLLSLAYGDAEIGEIERALKQQPHLGYNLLRLVNSAAGGLVQQIGSLRQAVVLLGRRQLTMWLQLLLYAGEHSNRQSQSPLLQMAAMRGRTMELAAQRLEPHARDLHDRAFMTGMLSLMDVLLGMSRAALLDDLRVAADVRAALLDGTGVLGDLLALAGALERDDRDAVSTTLAARPGLGLRELLADQLAAFEWANSLFEEVGSPRAARRGG